MRTQSARACWKSVVPRPRPRPSSSSSFSKLSAPNVSIAAFTLIELLVVVAIIALLAGMVFPVTAAINRAKVKARSRADLATLQTAIESYKLKLGHYPPDARNAVTNQLFYELMGSVASQSGARRVFTTVEGNDVIADNVTRSLFGVDGFVNATRGAGSDESSSAVQFLRTLRPDQVGGLTNSTGNGKGSMQARVLVGYPWRKIPGNSAFSQDPVPDTPGLNPWRYRTRETPNFPLNNSGGYDLWIDVNIGGTVFRICNWSSQALKVNTPLQYQ